MTTPTPNPSGDSFRAPRTVTPLSVPALNYDRLRFPLTHDQLSSLVRGALEEDQAFNDVTTIATVLTSRRARASLVARQPGCIAGVSLALEAFRLLDPKISMRVDTEDGTRVEKGDTVIYMTGHARALLSAERTALNFMQRLLGHRDVDRAIRRCRLAARARRFSTRARRRLAGVASRSTPCAPAVA
jgi:nicotinate-nucleotide pyrophosphorylase (carboxylating)